MRKKLILGSCSLVLLCFVLISLARAGGEKAEPILWDILNILAFDKL